MDRARRLQPRLRVSLQALVETLVKLTIWLIGIMIALTIVLPGLEPGSLREGTTTMKRWHGFAASLALFCAAVVVNGGFPAAHAKPEGEMRFAVYVTVAPGWLDPAEAGPGFGTPFWFS